MGIMADFAARLWLFALFAVLQGTGDQELVSFAVAERYKHVHAHSSCVAGSRATGAAVFCCHGESCTRNHGILDDDGSQDGHLEQHGRRDLLA